MNFFNDVPDSRFFDPAYLWQVLRRDYVEVPHDFVFGDLLVVLEEGKLPVHMAVYIADDVVFTKNGLQDLQPWVLMKTADMLARYSLDKPVTVTGYRRKES
jgi:hypothetical protein